MDADDGSARVQRARLFSVQPKAISNPGAEIKQQSRMLWSSLGRKLRAAAVTQPSSDHLIATGLAAVPKSPICFDSSDMRVRG